MPATAATLQLVPKRSDQALHEQNFPPEKLLGYARHIARHKHMAGHEDRREDLVSYLVEIGTRYAARYNPDLTSETGRYSFGSWVYDIMEKRVPDFFRSQAEGYADTRDRFKTPHEAHSVVDDLAIDKELHHELFLEIFTDERLKTWAQAAAQTEWSLKEFVVITLDLTANHILHEEEA